MPSSEPHAERLSRLAAARLYLVCDSKPGGRELAEVLPGAIAGGVDIVQLREKNLTDAQLLMLARDARALTERLGALFIVNDRPRVAREADADGVHVGQQDMPLPDVRAEVGPGMLIGLSTHAPQQIDAVAAEVHARSPQARAGRGADYIGVGPVHSTPTKPGRPAAGLGLVRYAAAHAPLPFFAIGGIERGNVGEVIGSGASRVCVLRAIADAEDPERAARELSGLLCPRAPQG